MAGPPLVGCHGDGAHFAAIRERERRRDADAWSRLVAATDKRLDQGHALSGLVPGGRAWSEVSGYGPGHFGALLAIRHLLEPSPQTASVLLNFLRWTREQESLLLGAGIAVGQFFKGAVLALDAVGGELSEDERRDLLEHFILCAVENADADDIINHHPVGMPPLASYLDIPGTGFHLADGQVNNWDVISAMALLYIARAVDVVMPERAADTERWLALVAQRLERFFRICFTAEGEYCEGPGYYSYGCMAATHVLDVLSHWQRGREVLDTLSLDGYLATPRWSREMYHGDLANGHFNFNDSLSNRHELAGMVYWIAAHTGDTQAQHYGDQLAGLAAPYLVDEDARLESALFSSLWRDPGVGAEPPIGRRCVNFGRTGTVTCRTGYADHDVHALLRAGDYVGAHTHPDRGNLLLSMNGVDLLSDAGMPIDRRIPAYLDYHCTTRAHNCLLIDGDGQTTGEPPDFPAGRITRCEETPDGVYITADCSAVYSPADTVVRQVYFSWSGWLLLHDVVTGYRSEVSALLHTVGGGDVRIAESGAGFVHGAATLRVMCLEGVDDIADTGPAYRHADENGQHGIKLRYGGSSAVLLLAPAVDLAAPVPPAQRVDALTWQVGFGGTVETVRFEPA